MKIKRVLKLKNKLVYIFLVFFIIFSQINFVYADTDEVEWQRDQSISGIIQDGSSFIELRGRTRITNSTKWY